MSKRAFPLFYNIEKDPTGIVHYEAGLTKREYFAAMALQALLQNPDEMQPKLMIQHALYITDELLKELAKGDE